VGRFRLILIVDEEELGKVEVGRRSCVELAGAATTSFLEGLVGEGELFFATYAPGCAPLVPSLEGRGDALVVARVDPIGGETRFPVRDRSLEKYITHECPPRTSDLVLMVADWTTTTIGRVP